MDLLLVHMTIRPEVSLVSFPSAVTPSYFASGALISWRAPVGHFLAQMPHAMHLNGSVCLVPSKNMLAVGQNPTHIRHDVHLSLRTCTTPFASRSRACVGHTLMHAPHCEQMLMLEKPVLFTTFTLERSGDSSLNHAFEHAVMHSPHCTHFSAFTCITFTQNPSWNTFFFRSSYDF